MTGPRQRGGGLDQQRRFADARVAGHQQHRTAHEAAAGDAVTQTWDIAAGTRSGYDLTELGESAAIGAASGFIGGRVGAKYGKAGEGEPNANESSPSFCSFSADTPVATPGGKTPIASVRPGDEVQAYDPKTGETHVSRYLHVVELVENDKIEISLDDARARVRGIDRNGNVGSWSTPTGVTF